MFIAQDKQGTYVQANVARTTGEFYCPGCLAPVYLRQGEIKQPHSAHLNAAGKSDYTGIQWQYADVRG